MVVLRGGKKGVRHGRVFERSAPCGVGRHSAVVEEEEEGEEEEEEEVLRVSSI